MMITRKHLPRRAFLRGLGAAVALPWLDAMVPAFAAPAQKQVPVRLVFGYVPNGMMMADWTPKGVGKDFEFARILKPLEPFREDVLILTGLHHRNGEGSGGDHARAIGQADPSQRRRENMAKQRCRIINPFEHALRHAVMQKLAERAHFCLIEGVVTIPYKLVLGHPLDAVHGKTAVAGNVGGLRCPG